MVTVNTESKSTSVKSAWRLYNGNLLPAPGEYNLDPTHSFTEFIAQHIVVGQVWGRFDSISGTLQMAEDPEQSQLTVTIAADSVSTHKKERDDDLRSPRFFDAANFPEVVFKSTNVKAEPGGKFTIDGNLTIKAITRPVSLSATFSGMADDPWGNTRAAFHANTKINRRDFNLLADIERETGGLTVGADVSLWIATETILKK